MFSFPRIRSPTRAQTQPPSPPLTPDSGLVIDIRGPDSSDSTHGQDNYDYDEAEATPVRERPTGRLGRSHVYSSSEVLPRIVPMPMSTHTHSDSEQLHARTRPGTPFADYTRPTTPFAELARPETPFADLDPLENDDPEPTVTYLSPGVSRKERGQGWSGEWNQRDMQDVIQKLRSLK